MKKERRISANEWRDSPFQKGQGRPHPGVGKSRGASCSATRLGSTLRGTLRKRSRRVWIEFAPKWAIQRINSFPRPPVGFSIETNGDFAKRSLVGGFTGAYRIWSGIQTPGCRGARGRLESQPDPDFGVCASDKQPSMGKCAGECLPLSPLDRLAERFGCERVSDWIKTLLTERVGKLLRAKQEAVLAGIDVVLGR